MVITLFFGVLLLVTEYRFHVLGMAEPGYVEQISLSLTNQRMASVGA